MTRWNTSGVQRCETLQKTKVWSDLTYCNQTRHRWHLRTAVNHQRGAMLSWVSSIACFKPHFTCLCLLCHRPSVSGWEVIKKTSCSCRECDSCLFLGTSSVSPLYKSKLHKTFCIYPSVISECFQTYSAVCDSRQNSTRWLTQVNEVCVSVCSEALHSNTFQG